MKRVPFTNRSIDVVGDLHLPAGLPRRCIHLRRRTGHARQQREIGAVYASKLAERGFVAPIFDPAQQGDSGGEHIHLEHPAVRVEDIRCAVDDLMIQPFVSEDRVGLLGMRGSDYAVYPALTEHGCKGVQTVVASAIGGRTLRHRGDTAKNTAALNQCRRRQ